MADINDILGNERVKEHFIAAVHHKKISHAYIIEGDKGSGKKMLASAFSKILQCETRQKTEEERACNQCESCIQMENKDHPDVIWVSHEKAGVISVGEIREQVVNTVDIMPYKGPYKIYIIDEAEKMTIQAQNALLKTIEEPPAYAVILLLANNNTGLLPTITSRCVTLNFKPVRDEVIRKYLMEELHVPDYQADVSVAFAQGNVGKAKQIATAEDFTEMMDAAFRILRRGSDMEVYEMVDALKNLSEQKHTIYEYLDLFLVWFRDVLLFKATKEMDSLVFKEEYNFIKERADKSSYEGLETIIKAIETAKARLQANVNFDLTMELLFLTIREN